MNKIKKAWRVLTQDGLSVFNKKLKEFLILKRKQLTRLSMYPYASYKLPKIAAKDQSVDSAMDVIYNKFGKIFRPQQVKFEIASLSNIVRELKPTHVLEIGTATGGSLFLFSRFSDPTATIVSIDLPKGASGGFYKNMGEKLYKKFAGPNQHMTLLRRNSHDMSTRQELEGLLKGEPLDFLFIDGDHSYAGVKQDYELYSPLVRTGGVIAFHDVCKHPEKCDVDKFWHEVKAGKNYKELVENYDQGWAGIGVIFT